MLPSELRDHSQPCEHVDIAEEVRPGQWMCMGNDCPGGRRYRLDVDEAGQRLHDWRYRVRPPGHILDFVSAACEVLAAALVEMIHE